MLLFFSSGLIHRFPHAFAVDNQERVYLLYAEGGYCVTEYGATKVLPKFEESCTISISDDNLLSYARNDEITVYDINTSNPEMGKLSEIDRYTTSDKDAIFLSRRLGNGDEQNGVTYAYDQNLFSYQITRTEDGETSLFYRMPTLDVIWNLLKMSYIPLMIVSILRAILYYARALIAE
ncbi:MAG: hypothetical protein HGA90_05965, partial [Alphaproteobacteria bacterium]|nr:hypothetical protein [Alphaproteobacteria bacterium]